MSDMLIRDIPAAVVAALDARARLRTVGTGRVLLGPVCKVWHGVGGSADARRRRRCR